MARSSFGLPTINDMNLQGRAMKGTTWEHQTIVGYEVQDVCTYEGGWYQCILPSDASLDATRIPTNTTYWKQLGGSGGIDEYSTTETYEVGDIVWLKSNDQIYRNITEITTGESFTDSKWTELSKGLASLTGFLHSGGAGDTTDVLTAGVQEAGFFDITGVPGTDDLGSNPSATLAFSGTTGVFEDFLDVKARTKIIGSGAISGSDVGSVPGKTSVRKAYINNTANKGPRTAQPYIEYVFSGSYQNLHYNPSAADFLIFPPGDTTRNYNTLVAQQTIPADDFSGRFKEVFEQTDWVATEPEDGTLVLTYTGADSISFTDTDASWFQLTGVGTSSTTINCCDGDGTVQQTFTGTQTFALKQNSSFTISSVEITTPLSVLTITFEGATVYSENVSAYYDTTQKMSSLVRYQINAAITAGTITGFNSTTVKQNISGFYYVEITGDSPGARSFIGLAMTDSVGGGNPFTTYTTVTGDDGDPKYKTAYTITAGSIHSPSTLSSTFPNDTSLADCMTILRAHIVDGDIGNYTTTEIVNSAFEITSEDFLVDTPDFSITLTQAGTGSDLVFTTNVLDIGSYAHREGTQSTGTVTTPYGTFTIDYESGITVNEQASLMETHILSQIDDYTFVRDSNELTFNDTVKAPNTAITTSWNTAGTAVSPVVTTHSLGRVPKTTQDSITLDFNDSTSGTYEFPTGLTLSETVSYIAGLTVQGITFSGDDTFDIASSSLTPGYARVKYEYNDNSSVTDNSSSAISITSGDAIGHSLQVTSPTTVIQGVDTIYGTSTQVTYTIQDQDYTITFPNGTDDGESQAIYARSAIGGMTTTGFSILQEGDVIYFDTAAGVTETVASVVVNSEGKFNGGTYVIPVVTKITPGVDTYTDALARTATGVSATATTVTYVDTEGVSKTVDISVGASTEEAEAIALNTLKVGITTEQAAQIVTNNGKVGITTDQASEIVANNSKVSNVTSWIDYVGGLPGDSTFLENGDEIIPYNEGDYFRLITSADVDSFYTTRTDNVLTVLLVTRGE